MNASQDGAEPIPEQRDGGDEDLARHERGDDGRDLAEHEKPTREEPETGLISDEELPEDLRPTDDNPLAKNPGDEDDSGGDEASDAAKAAGMPDLGGPGGPGGPA